MIIFAQRMQETGWWAPLHEPRKLSHFPRGMKIVFAPKAIWLHWPVLLGRWRSHKNLHCMGPECFARLAPNIVPLFYHNFCDKKNWVTQVLWKQINWPPGAAPWPTFFVKLSCGPVQSPIAWPFSTGIDLIFNKKRPQSDSDPDPKRLQTLFNNNLYSMLILIGF